jgi:hypothetical protein
MMWLDSIIIIVSLSASHAACATIAYRWTRDHYEDKLNNLRFKARIITGIDVTRPDGRWPD